MVDPPFSRRLSPVETALAKSAILGRRIGFERDLRSVILPLVGSVEQRGSVIRLPRFLIRACSASIRFEKEQSAILAPSRSLLGKVLLFVNYLPDPTLGVQSRVQFT